MIFDIETSYNPDLVPLALELADVEVREEEVKQEMALDPFWGQIVAVGVMSEDKRGERIKIFTGDEPEMLAGFWDIAGEFRLFVGFNSMEFDVPYLELRSAINGIARPVKISTRRYQWGNHIDLYMLLTHWRGNRSKYLKFDLRTVGRALGVDHTVGDPSKVPQWFFNGELEKIKEHLGGDLKTTKAIYDQIVGML